MKIVEKKSNVDYVQSLSSMQPDSQRNHAVITHERPRFHVRNPKEPTPTDNAELRNPMYTNKYEYAIPFPNAQMYRPLILSKQLFKCLQSKVFGALINI
jgi:hypothetical protein